MRHSNSLPKELERPEVIRRGTFDQQKQMSRFADDSQVTSGRSLPFGTNPDGLHNGDYAVPGSKHQQQPDFPHIILTPYEQPHDGQTTNFGTTHLPPSASMERPRVGDADIRVIKQFQEKVSKVIFHLKPQQALLACHVVII
jgi:hypothetical protein